MSTIAERAARFADLHGRERPFIMPNPWDIGTARMLEMKGFEAVATTSSGFDNAHGRRDATATREQALKHAADIVEAVDIPVSADFVDCFERTPEGVAETIRLAAGAGVAGCSIEDARSQGEGDAIYPPEEAVERVRAAAEAAAGLDRAFVLTARAENFLHGRPDLDDTIRRLQAFQEAGAAVLYAPGLRSREHIASVVASVDLPVNVLMAGGSDLTLDDLAEIGVRRVSVGSALFRAAFGAAIDAADEMAERGSFTFADTAAGFGNIARLVTRG